MAAWQVSGAGDSAYDGVYNESGTFAGKPAYTDGAGHWLFFGTVSMVGSRWCLYTEVIALGSAYYGGADLPGEWNVTPAVGTAPAPTVTEDTGSGTGGAFGWGWFEITDPVLGDTITPGTYPVAWRAATDVLPDGFLEPGLFSANLWAWLVYADGTQQFPPTGPIAVTAPLAWNETDAVWEVIGTIDVPVSALHGASCAVHVGAQGTITDSSDPANEWTFTATAEMTGIAIAGEATGSPPTVAITSPANEATVSATVAVAIQATDDKGLTTLALSIDGTPVGTQAVAGLSAAWTYSWNTALATNGLHYLTATATDSDGLTDTDTVVVTVANGAPGGGTDPTCEIHAPGAGATVGGTYECDLRGLDDGTIDHAWFYIDGALVASWDPAVATWLQLWDWDTLGFGNGTHVLDLTVEDNDGNVALATRRTVTVDNAAVPGEGDLWVSEKLASIPAGASPLAAQIAEQVGLGRKAQRGLVTAVIEQAALPENNCGLRIGVLSGGDWTEGVTTLDDCQSMIPDTVLAFAEPWEDARVAIQFTALVDWTQWSVDNPAVIDHQVISDTKLLVLVAGPPAVIYKWDGAGDMTEWLSLAGTEWSGYTAVGFRVLGGKCYIAATTDEAVAQPVVLVQDLDGSGEPDAAQEVYLIGFASPNPHAITDIEVLGEYVVVGTDDGAGAGHLWRIQPDDVRFLSAAVPGVRCLWADGDTLYIGGADGKVWTGGASQYDTGEDHCNSGLVVSGKHYVCTGDGGKVFRRVGTTWELLATIPTVTEPKPLGVYYGRVWFGGDGADLYALDLGSGTFQKYCETAFTAITDLVGFGGMLVVFGTGGGSIYKSLAITSSHLTGYLVHELGLQVLEWAE